MSVTEIRQTEKLWIKQAQTAFKNDANLKKVYSQLDIIEMDGVLVCKGRFENADMPIEAKYPIYLPKQQRLRADNNRLPCKVTLLWGKSFFS